MIPSVDISLAQAERLHHDTQLNLLGVKDELGFIQIGLELIDQR